MVHLGPVDRGKPEVEFRGHPLEYVAVFAVFPYRQRVLLVVKDGTDAGGGEEAKQPKADKQQAPKPDEKRSESPKSEERDSVEEEDSEEDSGSAKGGGSETKERRRSSLSVRKNLDSEILSPFR